jgi:hypothetical protein
VVTRSRHAEQGVQEHRIRIMTVTPSCGRSDEARYPLIRDARSDLTASTNLMSGISVAPDGIVCMISRGSASRLKRIYAIRLVTGLISVVGSIPANGQQQSSPSQAHDVTSTADAPSEKSDITVIGNVEPELPSTVPVKPRPERLITDRLASTEAYRFAQCAKRADPKLVRQAIEGLPHRYDSEYALDRIIREEQACYAGLPALLSPSPFYGQCNPMVGYGDVVCRAFFDRGALIERAISKVTPSLSLRDGDLADRAVIDRFNSLTSARNTTRYPQERIGYAVVACMVASHTTDAMSLIRSKPGTSGERRLSAILLGQSPQCLGGAKKISTDTRQFRVYVADVTYFFAAAFRDVKSLIPDDAKRE